MGEHTRRAFLLSLTVPFAISATACNKTSPAQQVADQFMEAYYVRIDVASAVPFTEGLAKEKLQGQLSLMQSDGGPESASGKPSVSLSLIDQKTPTPDSAIYVYKVKTGVKDLGDRNVFVKLRQTGDKWLVSQFTEDDG